ncbi:NADP-dependent 3-hydroxy acid dehydrogenase YdfG [Filimonas lacunae]|uniref:NADP-dependent 3-hydroxy acid dehydrogenase YdfG n=1 Tax=Filimonas lacunae TaxID=477680 RepID=A0A173MH51_9BACT|nr:SDR family NAD(P)-dependent oxidoreductase [Filimonas lacunae]BAV06933.1 oxidoreductase [Filimonas lacunae]SIS97619.1 NADP-dependent 3-hydroxy acid dehydrogenase YdfG [Filimonas lacunae]
MSKVVFITGASKGFGRLWTEALLKRGDKVVAAVRNIAALKELVDKYPDNLLPLRLDVDKREDVFATVAEAIGWFGRIDVVINNAGFGLFGITEEATEQQARQQMDTNFFGSLWVVQAILPIMRKQRSGHIIQVSSYLGITTLPMLGLYNASKFAVEGMIETISKEVGHLGIRTTLIEPNGFATDWAGASAAVISGDITDYDVVRASSEDSGGDPSFWGKPAATVEPLLKIIDHPHPPERLLLGRVAYESVYRFYTWRLQEIEAWKQVSIAAHGH